VTDTATLPKETMNHEVFSVTSGRWFDSRHESMGHPFQSFIELGEDELAERLASIRRPRHHPVIGFGRF
jgi:hypothetical protein